MALYPKVWASLESLITYMYEERIMLKDSSHLCDKKPLTLSRIKNQMIKNQHIRIHMRKAQTCSARKDMVVFVNDDGHTGPPQEISFIHLVFESL